jgi:phosphate transport system substrate-binding protein
MPNRRPNELLFAVALCGFGAFLASAAEMPSYEPRSVEFPTNASYVQPDGSIYIVGNDGMEAILKQFNELFAKTHPGFKFKMLLKGSSTGIGGLTAGVSAFAPMGREAWGTDVSGFREVYGSQPFDIHIGYDGFVRPKHKNPPAIYVNAKNPLAGLTLEELTRVFTSGHPKGDVTHWKQLGLGANGRSTRCRSMANRTMAARQRRSGEPSSEDVPSRTTTTSWKSLATS